MFNRRGAVTYVMSQKEPQHIGDHGLGAVGIVGAIVLGGVVAIPAAVAVISWIWPCWPLC